MRLVLISCMILWGASALDDLARRKTIPRPPDCPDCKPAIRSALVAILEVP